MDIKEIAVFKHLVENAFQNIFLEGNMAVGHDEVANTGRAFLQ